MLGTKQRLSNALLTSTACLTAVGLILAATATAQARVTRIAIEKKASPAFDGASFGNAGQYETLAGKAFGELDPNDPHNAVIQDIKLAPRNARGMVEYTATFQIVKPLDMSKASRLMWHDVPNRAGRITIVPIERANGDIGLSSGWQGDNSGRTAPGPNNDYVVVPTARKSGRLGDHRPRHGADHECLRQRLAADDHAQQPDALSSGEPGYQGSEPCDPRIRDDRRR